jgi:hypothetical protein
MPLPDAERAEPHADADFRAVQGRAVVGRSVVSRCGHRFQGCGRFVAELSRETGTLLKQKTAGSASPTLLIHAAHGRESVQRLGEDESYELVISKRQAGTGGGCVQSGGICFGFGR